MRKLLLLVALLGMPGCRDDCTTSETRCEGQKAQICTGSHWVTMQDCDLVSQQSGAQFACCLYPGDDGGTPAGATCLLSCGGDQ